MLEYQLSLLIITGLGLVGLTMGSFAGAMVWRLRASQLRDEYAVGEEVTAKDSNEVHAIKDAGGFVIRLTRDTNHSTHSCESALNKDVFDWDIFDYIIDNQGYSISELQEQTLLMNHIWRN